MLTIRDQGQRLCDGMTRRDWLRVGGLGMFGLSLPEVMQRRALAAQSTGTTPGKAKSCIVLFLLGGPPQHETWDPKPDAPTEIRGDLQPIRSKTPGLWVGELMPKTAQLTDKIAVLRGVQTNDNAHSTSGYAMTTGLPHLPLGVEGAAPGAPNNRPCLGAIVKHLRQRPGALPAAMTIPEVAANDGNKTWPGQDAGWLGRAADPWVLEGDPSAKDFTVPDLALTKEVPALRFDQRKSLLAQVDAHLADAERSDALAQFDSWRQQAFDLLRSPKARDAFNLTKEPTEVRERYGMNRFGQSVLLARRLIEAGVSLTRVNWSRIKGALNNGHWDTHGNNTEALRKWLMPRMDQAYSALLEDLTQRGLLDETLVVWMGEFGRTPKINGRGGRDHWGKVFSVALAGGGVQGGAVYGASDRLGGEPVSGRVRPQDLSATIYRCLGLDPRTHIVDQRGRPHPISSGRPIGQIL